MLAHVREKLNIISSYLNYYLLKGVKKKQKMQAHHKHKADSLKKVAF